MYLYICINLKYLNILYEDGNIFNSLSGKVIIEVSSGLTSDRAVLFKVSIFLGNRCVTSEGVEHAGVLVRLGACTSSFISVLLLVRLQLLVQFGLGGIGLEGNTAIEPRGVKALEHVIFFRLGILRYDVSLGGLLVLVASLTCGLIMGRATLTTVKQLDV